MASSRIQPAVYKPKPPLYFRVYAHGSAHHLAEGDEATARAAALTASKDAPAHRYELREVPAEVRVAQGVPLANEGGRYERAVAAYQGGKEVPVA